MQGPLASERNSLLIAGSLLIAAALIGRRRIGGPNQTRVPSSGDALGRSERGPREAVTRGWKGVLTCVFKSLSGDRVLANAAGVTFYSLLALFPAIAALVSIYGLFADPADISRQLESMSDLLPGGAIDVIGDQLRRVSEQARGALGFGAIAGLLIALWSANSGMKALFDALNVVYGVRERRGFFKLNAISLAFTLSGIVFVVVAIGVIVAVPVALELLPLRGAFAWLIHALRWPVLLIGIIVALAFLYRYGPSRAHPRWRLASWGSVIAGVAWVAASVLFSWYAENFGTYNKTYGSLGAVIGFMTWMWISAIVVLMGGEFDAETEPPSARDTI